jgi:hypothetical protein
MRSAVKFGVACLAWGVSSLSPAFARCADPADRAVFDLEGLKSEMMVLAISCQRRDDYNAFVRKYQALLTHVDAELGRYFARAYGKGGQRAQDAYVTALANGQADEGMRLGSDFCPHHTAVFDEVKAVTSEADLPAFAAGKAVVPEVPGACVGTSVQASATHAPAKKR